jgi:hypothetical protein
MDEKSNGDWWKTSSMLSGPQGRPRPSTASSTPAPTNSGENTPSSATPISANTHQPFDSVPSKDVATPDQDERRRQMRLATERRLNQMKQQ